MMSVARHRVLLRQNVNCFRSASTLTPPAPGPLSPSSSSSPSSSTQPKSQTALAEKLMRRFWKTVSVEKTPDGNSYKVTLDRRTLKTPHGTPLTLPRSKLPLALLVAEEWENQVAVLKPHALPLTSVTARALDGDLDKAEVREKLVDYLLKYLDTDTVCFHETAPPALVRLQDEHWKPLMDWVRSTFKVDIVVYEGLLGTRQPERTREELKRVVLDRYDHFRLAAFERAVLASKSYLIALALVEGHFTPEEAALASHVEVSSQIERWGEVEDTHDVDHQDVRVRLGSAALLCSSLPTL